MRLVRVVLEVCFQTHRKMPQADDEESDDDRATDDLKAVPEGRLEPRDEEGREEERDCGEDGLLESEVLAPLGLEELVNLPVVVHLHPGYPLEALRVRVVRAEDRAAEVAAVDSFQLRVVVGALLRVAQCAVGQRDERELARRGLSPSLQVRVALARELPVGGFDFSRRRRLLDLKDVVVIYHGALPKLCGRRERTPVRSATCSSAAGPERPPAGVSPTQRLGGGLLRLSTRRTDALRAPRFSLDEVEKGADGDASRAFRAEGFRLVAPGRARDVEVRPGDSVGELLDEGGGGYRPGLAPADVLDVCDVGLDLLRVLLVERQLPELLADLAARLDHFVNEFLIRSEYAGV